MTTQDRQLLDSLDRRHSQMELAMELLKSDLQELRSRLDSMPDVGLPETSSVIPPFIPPLRVEETVIDPPPIPILPLEPKTAEPLPPIPVVPESSETRAPEPVALEFQFGRWLARIGAVLALITLISFSTLAYKYFYHEMGPWSKLTILALVSGGLIAGGFRIERRNRDLIVYGRTLAGGGMACLYYTLYGATYVAQLRVIESPFLGGLILLAWSAWVLFIAEKKKSELLSVFAIALAYFSSAITPVGSFTMAANLILAATAVIFLLRNSWSGLSYLCLIGTYAGFLRQVVEPAGLDYLDLHWIRSLDFWPSAIYLGGAWIIFTGGVFLANTPQFIAGKRMAFLCLNNGAFIGLLIVAANLSNFGHLGGILCTVGALLLGCWFLARTVRIDERDLNGAYLMQGLALGTGGIAIAYAGVTRGLLITTESVFLVAAGAYSRNLILRIAGAISAALGTVYLIDEIGFQNHYPWTLTFCGTAAMLANAWFARRELWRETREVAAAKFVVSSAFYTVLGLAVLLTGIVVQPNDDWVAPGLALAALALTFAVYFIPIFEVPLLSQALLVLAQVIAFVPPLGGPPASQGMSLGSYAGPQWSANVVALITMILVAWWPRQKIVPTGNWLPLLTFAYALAMVAYGYNSLHPHLSDQNWMMASAALSLIFLAYGTWSKSWQFMASGQVFLGLSTSTLLFTTTGGNDFPWTWWAALVPPAVVFLTAQLAHRWLPRVLPANDSAFESVRVAAYLYDCLALGLLIRWVFGVVPDDYITFTLIALGTGVMLWNLRQASAFGVRMSFALTLAGACNYVGNVASAQPFTLAYSAGFLLFLAQPALLRVWGRTLVTEAESWAVIVISTLTSWLYVSNCIHYVDANDLTLGWGIFALALILLGFIANERRQRWTGLAVLAAALLRVAFHDFWLFSDVYKVVTFFILTVICLGLSFLYYKFADRLKEWL